MKEILGPETPMKLLCLNVLICSLGTSWWWLWTWIETTLWKQPLVVRIHGESISASLQLHPPWDSQTSAQAPLLGEQTGNQEGQAWCGGESGAELRSLASQLIGEKQWETPAHPGEQRLPPSPVAQMVKYLPATQETQVQSLGGKDPLEKGMAIHSEPLPGEFHEQRSLVGYSPWDSQRARHNWVTSTFTFTLMGQGPPEWAAPKLDWSRPQLWRLLGASCLWVSLAERRWVMHGLLISSWISQLEILPLCWGLQDPGHALCQGTGSSFKDVIMSDGDLLKKRQLLRAGSELGGYLDDE